MGEIIQRREDLPTTLDDLSRFVLVGREKLTAVRAEIRAIDKVGVATGVREQKLKEAQAISEAVLDAEVRIGELMAKVPTQSRYNATKRQDTDVQSFQTKTDVIEQAGLTVKQVQRFETLASHPDVVEQAKAKAREDGDIVTRGQVLDMIKDDKRPHVANNSGNNEWYTPAKYVELARKVLGVIDLDPASCEHANKTVKAVTYFNIDDDGLSQEWNGKVWMNPPYSADLIQQFAYKIVDEYKKGHTTEAVVLVNNATETQWFSHMTLAASAVAFPKGRIQFETESGKLNSPLQGQAFIYFGKRAPLFCQVFSSIGWVATIDE